VSWLNDMRPASAELHAKRLLDIVASGIGLVVLAPAMCGLMVGVAVTHGWPPVFVQERPGIRGRIFRMVKLRTMTNERGPRGALLPDAERLTPFGRFLRSASLDELPELWNVLVGDMSLVGPRPLLTKYLPLYTPEQMRRHDMPPGITGLVQTSGRNGLTWREKFDLDLAYVDGWSFGLDLRILGKTVRAVVLREGISARDDATMPEFTGSSDDTVDRSAGGKGATGAST